MRLLMRRQFLSSKVGEKVGGIYAVKVLKKTAVQFLGSEDFILSDLRY